MKLHNLPMMLVPGPSKRPFLSRNLVTASTKAAAQIELCKEEFVSKLLDRRWTLELPDSKIHQIMFSAKQNALKNGPSGDLNFSVNTSPKLGESAWEERHKKSSFYVVRDDLLHPLVNGNKARKLDALLPIIEDCSATDVVTCGGVQSAHAAAVAASCGGRGLQSHLLLRGEEPEVLTGYNLISSMYGSVVYVPRSLYAKREEMLLRHAKLIAGHHGSVVWLTDILDGLAEISGQSIHTDTHRSFKDGMKKVVIVKEGAGDCVALLGIIRQVQYLSQSHIFGNKKPLDFVIDSGTGTTAVGFALGALLLGLPWKVTAVMLADTCDGYKAQEKRLISDFKRYYESDLYRMDFPLKDDLVHWVNRATPRKFGNVLDGEVKACQQVANQTGILVDPIYTLAAWELAVQLSQKETEDGINVVMIHTGGTLGMFGLAQRYKAYFSTLKDMDQPNNDLTILL